MKLPNSRSEKWRRLRIPARTRPRTQTRTRTLALTLTLARPFELKLGLALGLCLSLWSASTIGAAAARDAGQDAADSRPPMPIPMPMPRPTLAAHQSAARSSETAATSGAAVAAVDQTPRPRARELGIAPGGLEPGPLNAITDVPDVRVGQVTLVQGDTIRTGVTAILPHGGNLFQDKVSGAVFVGNAFGKLAGSTQVRELGTIETPIVLTNTLAVGTAMEGVVRYTLAQPGNESVRSVNALVGETNDGGLNDIRALPITAAHVRQAIEAAKTGPVDEGAVGAGTGTVAFGWKGGIGTASRIVPVLSRRPDAARSAAAGGGSRPGAGATDSRSDAGVAASASASDANGTSGTSSTTGAYTLGVLVQSNFGGNQTIDGVPVWKTLGHAAFPRVARGSSPLPAVEPAAASAAAEPVNADGSCMIVVATDAPLSARDLERLAARALFGLARTGSSYTHGSGDFAIAFSTAADARVPFGSVTPRARTLLPSDAVSPLFQAALEATEEAVYNSMLRARTTTGNGVTIEALPLEPLIRLLKTRR